MRREVQNAGRSRFILYAILARLSPNINFAARRAIQMGQCLDFFARLGQLIESLPSRSAVPLACLLTSQHRIAERQQRRGSVHCSQVHTPLGHFAQNRQRRRVSDRSVFDHETSGAVYECLERQVPKAAVRRDHDIRLAAKLSLRRFEKQVVEFDCGVSKTQIASGKLLPERFNLLRELGSFDRQRINLDLRSFLQAW